MNNLIEVHLCGGLANQMFQYAAGRALALRLQVPLCLNISAFANATGEAAHAAWRLSLFPHAVANGVSVTSTPPSKLHNYLRRITAFAQAKLHRHTPLISGIVTEPHFEFWPGFERISSPCHLYGYW